MHNPCLFGLSMLDFPYILTDNFTTTIFRNLLEPRGLRSSLRLRSAVSLETPFLRSQATYKNHSFAVLLLSPSPLSSSDLWISIASPFHLSGNFWILHTASVTSSFAWVAFLSRQFGAVRSDVILCGSHCSASAFWDSAVVWQSDLSFVVAVLWPANSFGDRKVRVLILRRSTLRLVAVGVFASNTSSEFFIFQRTNLAPKFYVIETLVRYFCASVNYC